MRKVINGKMYDTETATELGSHSFSHRGDFHFYEETLYRKKTGEFFLYGEGGPLTQYARTVGLNEWSGGERIMPYSYKEAQKWAEDNLDADDYEEIFGKIDETEEKLTVTISLNAAKWEAAKREAAKKGISYSEYIESLL